MLYLIVIIIVNTLSYIANIILSNILTVKDYATIASDFSIAAFIATIAILGRPEYDLREMSLNSGKINYYSILLSMIIALLFCSAFQSSFTSIFLLSMIFIAVAFLSSGLKYKKQYILLGIIQKPINIIRVVLPVIILSSGIGFKISYHMSIFGVLTLVMLCVLVFINKHKDIFQASGNWMPNKNSIRFLMNEIAFTLYFQIGIIILTLYNKGHDVAIYSLASLLVVSSFGLLINAYYISYFTPIFYEKLNQNPCQAHKLLHQKVKQNLLLLPILVFLILLIIYYITPALIDLNKYHGLSNILFILAISVVFKFMYSPISSFMNLEKNIRIKNLALISASVSGLILALILAPYFGALGASIAYCITELIIFVFFKKTLKITKIEEL